MLQFVCLYCDHNSHDLQKCQLKPEIDLKITSLCIVTKQIDHLKVLRGRFSKNLGILPALCVSF